MQVKLVNKQICVDSTQKNQQKIIHIKVKPGKIIFLLSLKIESSVQDFSFYEEAN